MPLDIELEHSLAHALTTGLNLFLGAGFSVLAQNFDGKTLPIGADLHTELISHFGMQAERSLSILISFVQYSESSRESRTSQFLDRSFHRYTL